MKFSVLHTVAFACLLAAVSCKQEAAVSQGAAPAPSESDVGVITRVGSVAVTEADLAWHLKQNHSGRSDAASRQAALDELTGRARLTQAAHDAGLDSDPVARAEIARILGTRLRETQLDPKLREIATAEIPEARLREIYEGRLFYGRDAFEGLHVMDRLGELRRTGEHDEEFGLVPSGRRLPAREKVVVDPASLPRRSPEVALDNQIFVPPFLGSRVVKGLSIDDLATYINETALFRNQWQYRPEDGENDDAFKARIRPMLRDQLARSMPSISPWSSTAAVLHFGPSAATAWWWRDTTSRRSTRSTLASFVSALSSTPCTTPPVWSRLSGRSSGRCW